MEGAYKCKNCSRAYSEKIHYDNHVRSHKKCQHPGCDFEAIHKVLNDHILVHTIPKELFFDSPEDIAKWREERRRNYPTREAIQRKLTEREEKLKRGEVLPTRVSKYKGHGFHNSNSESNFRFGRGRGRGSFSRGRGRGFHRGRGGARHFDHHSHFTSHHHRGDDDDNSVDVSEDEQESVGEATVLLSQTTSSFPVDGISSSGRPPSSDSTLELSGPPSTTPASELSGREACVLDFNGSVGGRDSSLKHPPSTSAETTTSSHTPTDGDVQISVKSSTVSASTQSTCTHVTTTEDGVVVESSLLSSTVSPTRTSARSNAVCSIVVPDDIQVSQQGLPLQDTPHLDTPLEDTPQHSKDTPIQEAAWQKAALNDASLLESSVSARLAHGHSEVGSHWTGGNCPSQVQHNIVKRKKLTLLQKLLAPEIRSERNKILQCVRFIVQNNFFDESNPQN